MKQLLQTKHKQKFSFTNNSISLFQRKKKPGWMNDGWHRKRQMIQRKPVNNEERSEIPPIVHEVLRSPGQVLNDSTRLFMELKFGHDFSKVRVHTDSKAAESAKAVNAKAYTVGKNIVFNAGQYSPETNAGKQLLAHELTHTIQQLAHNQQLAANSGIISTEALEKEALNAESAILMGDTFKSTLSVPIKIARSALAEREREVVALNIKGKTYVLYQKEVRTGGSSSWLANNPGNMDYTADTVRWGAYEGKGLKWGIHRFAIFPTERVGLDAIKFFLRKHQTIEKRHRTIYAMMTMWAPGKEPPNDPETYAKNIGKVLKLPITALVKDMDDSHLEIFAKEIQINEGWKHGLIYNRDDPSLPEEVNKL
jgi:hypothetical protein